MSIQLSKEDYSALVALARRGTTTPEQTTQLEQFLNAIERTNGITRYVLAIRWQEADYPMPPTTRFPAVWPPNMQTTIERFDRPSTKAEATAALRALAKNPVTVMVTPDPAFLVGWTSIDAYFMELLMRMDLWIGCVILVAAVITSIVGIRLFLREKPTVREAVFEDEAPRCICGDEATEPMPSLSRDRKGSVLSQDRETYAAPPHYVRRVPDSDAKKELCRVHAHVADSVMDEFLFTKIRAIQAEANAKIALEAAQFEKEVLPKSIQQSLTAKEKNRKTQQNGAYQPLNGSPTPPSLSS